MPVEAKLPPNHFSNVIRLIKNAPLDRAKVLKTATWETLRRLGVKRDPSKAVSGLPKGSDQGDIMSLVAWMYRIKPEDKEAVEQVVAIDATCYARVKS